MRRQNSIRGGGMRLTYDETMEAQRAYFAGEITAEQYAATVSPQYAAKVAADKLEEQQDAYEAAAAAAAADEATAAALENQKRDYEMAMQKMAYDAEMKQLQYQFQQQQTGFDTQQQQVAYETQLGAIPKPPMETKTMVMIGGGILAAIWLMKR